MYSNINGDYNVSIGSHAGNATTSATYNNFIGNRAGSLTTTGGRNNVLGNHAFVDNTTGTNNTCLGDNAGRHITSNSNTCLGFEAGTQLVAHTDCVMLGSEAGKSSTAASNELYIARNNQGAGNAATWIYGDSSGSCHQGDNSTTWSQTSDRRLKKNIVDSHKGLAEINTLRVTNFEYRLENEIDMSEFPLAEGDASKVVLGKDKDRKNAVRIVSS